MSDASPDPALEAFERIEVVQTVLQVLRRTTGLRIAVVAHVTETTWTACAVLGETSFGLRPGSTLPLETTFCNTVRCAAQPLRISDVGQDPNFAGHPARSLYGVESYIAVPIHRRDGSFFGVLCALDAEPAQLTDEHLEIFHLLATLIAFELEAAEREKQREVALRALEDFIAVAAHDLKQPLTTVVGRAQMLSRQLKREAASAAVLTSIDTLLSQARRAVHLSETVLDMAELDTGRFALDRAECDLVVLASDVLDDLRVTTPEHIFALDAPPSLIMQLDQQRMVRVLRNVLDNAVKYSPADAGPIWLHIEGAPDGGALLRVVDRGPGVKAAELPYLFTRRYRASNALGHGTSGSGLGLYIVNTIVVAHGGAVWAELPPEGGLAVIISLPAGGSPQR